ncbi:hypothetical protein BCF44_101192 [Kutzneria buriramensis]|uniref:Uncharacterized protein n=1 Tax=Kutzneria buriramensis TaxID=1045776 RepID=A0A3E0I9E1_9PSEU|nr:hypothetical protein BCF44_101192 [Kutzneria buriramensis]
MTVGVDLPVVSEAPQGARVVRGMAVLVATAVCTSLPGFPQ